MKTLLRLVLLSIIATGILCSNFFSSMAASITIIGCYVDPETRTPQHGFPFCIGLDIKDQQPVKTWARIDCLNTYNNPPVWTVVQNVLGGTYCVTNPVTNVARVYMTTQGYSTIHGRLYAYHFYHTATPRQIYESYAYYNCVPIVGRGILIPLPSDFCAPRPTQRCLQFPPPPGPNPDRLDPQICASPLLIDLNGNGLQLSSATEGVVFDLDANPAENPKYAWTLPNSDDSWLALDRNVNGKIDDGIELFGNVTPQPAPPEGEVRNGFLALAEFDLLSKGGNNDGFISSQDQIWPYLRLWQDLNHNGLSSSDELLTLDSQGVAYLALRYNISHHTDVHGNLYRYVSVAVMNDYTPRKCNDVYPAWVE